MKLKDLMGLRFSEVPSKQFALFLFLSSSELRDYADVCVDVACNNFNNLGLVRCAHYIGTDIESYEIPKVKSIPRVDFVLSDVTKDPVPNADLVICVETIGITQLFDDSQSLKVVEKLVSAVSPAGRMVVNVGPHTNISDHLLIEQLIRENFGKVRVWDYGRWSKPVNPLVSFFAGLLMLLIPSLRAPKRQDNVWKLYFASKKVHSA